MMPLRRTKIIATLGPASRSEATVRALLDSGVDTFRLNFSYGTADEHTRAIELIRRLSGETGKPVAIVQDLQGPKVRVARLDSEPFNLERGTLVTFTTESVTGNATRIPIDYPELPRAVKSGDRILMGDGEIELIVESSTDSEVRARVMEGGALKDNQGISLPGVAITADALTEKDLTDLRLGLLMEVDYVALSLVRSGDDVRRLKRLIRAEGAPAQVIAKLEKREAIDNLGDILAVADGVMVARGDLGLELPLEKVPLLQKEIIRRANARGVLVITATQMLQTMVDSPRPTRAEASDVTNAILDGTDAVMLSAETAVGRYPAESVGMMSRIALEAERWPAEGHSERPRLTSAHAMSRAACQLAKDVRASAIVVFTRSGYSAHLVSKERPWVPIFAFTPSRAVARQLTLWWGVTSLLVDFQPSLEEMISSADRCLTDQGHLRSGELTVLARWSSRRARLDQFRQTPQGGSAGMTPELVTVPDVAVAACERFLALRPRTVALAGGSTPRRLYQRLADCEFPWSQTEVYFGDERCVPPDHPDSNYRMAKEALLSKVPATVHRMLGETCDAAAYEDELTKVFGQGLPAFDLVLLGLGKDGHTASLFPGDAALDERDRRVVRVQRPDHARLTLTLPVLSAARVAMFIVSGASKRDALRRLLEREDIPAARVKAGRVLLVVDENASPRLPRHRV